MCGRGSADLWWLGVWVVCEDNDVKAIVNSGSLSYLSEPSKLFDLGDQFNSLLVQEVRLFPEVVKDELHQRN